jgi:HD superfamily phosphodiesterase
MSNTPMTLEDIIQKTSLVGEKWAVQHARRLLALIQEIGKDLTYDDQLVSLAAYLHDWGAFPAYAIKGVEHAQRSRQVVEVEILPFLSLSQPASQVLLETIELHDYRDLRPLKSNEALLLREADMLEFLGMIGMARDFARGPRDVLACYQRIQERKNTIQGRFALPRAREIAAVRLKRMDQCFGWLEEESFGSL